MATKNLIVHTLWIIQMYEIPRAKPPIQNCLSYSFRERTAIRTPTLQLKENRVYEGFVLDNSAAHRSSDRWAVLRLFG